MSFSLSLFLFKLDKSHVLSHSSQDMASSTVTTSVARLGDFCLEGRVQDAVYDVYLKVVDLPNCRPRRTTLELFWQPSICLSGSASLKMGIDLQEHNRAAPKVKHKETVLSMVWEMVNNRVSKIRQVGLFCSPKLRQLLAIHSPH